MNKWILRIIILLMIFLLMLGCGKSKIVKSTTSPKGNTSLVMQNNTNQPTLVDPIKHQIDGMTLNEKIGQMVMSGVDGYKIGDTTIKMLKNYHVGGFIIMGDNVQNAKQLRSLVNSLKTTNSKSPIPLFLSTDQEGGRVERMPPEIKRLPTNKAIGGVNNSEFSYKLGSIIAEELNSFGFNMDFAPVLDINSNPNNPVIGDRSFGSNPEAVTKLGIQTMKGIMAGNIIPVVKHFPGHGDTSVDSHVGLPLVNNNIKRLKSFEFIPFVQAIKNKVDAIMIAHILLPKIDSKYPASMSKTIITNILRKDLNFAGVVITDDLTMGAITKNYSIGIAAVKAINAGADIVLVCHGYNNEVAVVEALKKAVSTGGITKDRLNESLYRILKLKQKYKINSKTVKPIVISNINNKISNILKVYMK